MLSVHDCIAFSGLTADQLDAVAFNQNLAPILAAQWADTILDRPNGPFIIEQAIACAAVSARNRGKSGLAARFEAGLLAFRTADRPPCQG